MSLLTPDSRSTAVAPTAAPRRRVGRFAALAVTGALLIAGTTGLVAASAPGQAQPAPGIHAER